DANHRKETSSGSSSQELFRLASTGQCHAVGAEGRHLFKGGVLLFPIEEVPRSNTPTPSFRHILPERNQRVRILIRKRPQNHRINKRKVCSLATKTKHKSNHRHNSHTRMLRQHAQTESKILN